ncbi:putative ATP synthase subunit f, mitochondrial [Hyposmocoma kahamanoa]|uniref:putative ATP synthase subunit f, mitochondrial n=1 Tax=Hyposmocoma kahamanoa TaxID=1477025 RepID=UPI000E6D822A|nr:putative ATP synthase subunit f, mitochondrial [Hyposmocoma kahamanoa]
MVSGDYPKEYNPAMHRPYDPARYYRKADTPFSQLKISEIGSWFGRRNKTPAAVAGACSRAFWRWQHKYVQLKRVGMAPFFQFAVGSVAFFYAINYGKMKHHRNYKYH